MDNTNSEKQNSSETNTEMNKTNSETEKRWLVGLGWLISGSTAL